MKKLSKAEDRNRCTLSQYVHLVLSALSLNINNKAASYTDEYLQVNHSVSTDESLSADTKIYHNTRWFTGNLSAEQPTLHLPIITTEWTPGSRSRVLSIDGRTLSGEPQRGEEEIFSKLEYSATLHCRCTSLDRVPYVVKCSRRIPRCAY